MAIRGGVNLPSVGSFNERVILDEIRLAGPISRVELSQRTGLTAQTVSTIVRRLLASGVLEEGSRGPSTGGKPRTPIRVNPSAACAVGVHLDPHLINILVTDLGGKTRYARRTTPPSRGGATALVNKLLTEINAAMADERVAGDRLVGVGIAVPGPIDPVTNAMRQPPNMPGIHDAAVREQLESQLSGPRRRVVVENDATAAAIGEHWSGAEYSAEDFVYVYLGTGVGAGIFINGNIYRGATGNGGEIGHSSVNVSGPRCHCGNRGCLEMYCSPLAVLQTAKRLPASLAGHGGHAALQAAYARVCTDAARGAKSARSAITNAARHLAIASLTLVNTLDVKHLVFGGPALHDSIADQYLHTVLDTINAQSYTRSVRDVSVHRSALDTDAAAFGAASSVFHEVTSPRLPQLQSRGLDGVGRSRLLGVLSYPQTTSVQVSDNGSR